MSTGIKLSKKSSHTATHLQRFGFIKYGIIPVCMVIILLGVYTFWGINNNNSTYTNIEYIRSFMTSSGTLMDYSNKLAMHDPKTDIKFYKNEDGIRIEFGRMILTWTNEDFYTDTAKEALESIGFTYKIKTHQDGSKTLHLYYIGEEVERCTDL